MGAVSACGSPEKAPGDQLALIPGLQLALIPVPPGEAAPKTLLALPCSDICCGAKEQMIDDSCPNVSLEELRRPLCVYRRGMCASETPEAAVLVGPVVGKVTATTAAILIEVASPCDIILNLAPVHDCVPPELAAAAAGGDCRSSEGWPDNGSASPLLHKTPHEMEFVASGTVSVCHRLEPGRPYIFGLRGLEPGRAYTVFVSNVRQEDMDTRVARFRTLPEHMDRLRIVVVCGHQDLLVPFDGQTPWEHLHELATAGPEVGVVLHVGCTVDVRPAAKEAARLLEDLPAFQEGARRDLERLARRTLRRAYASAWGTDPGMRRVLAEVGSHLPIFSPPINFEALIDCSGPSHRALVRATMEVSRDYQRALWQANSSVPDVILDARGGGGHVTAVPAVPESLRTPSPRRESRDAVDGETNDEYWHEAGLVSSDNIEEWQAHWYGGVCIFGLDTKGHLLSNATSATAGELLPFLSKAQWHALDQVMADETTQVLVLACDEPFTLADENASAHVGGPTGEDGVNLGSTEAGNPRIDNSRVRRWSYHTEELVKLLTKLFEWKQAQYPSREVVLVSGGAGFGTTGDIRDHVLGMTIHMIITGPVLSRESRTGRKQPLKGSLAQGRFTYYHRPPTLHCNFGIVDIDLAADKPAVDVELIAMRLPGHVKWAGDGEPAKIARLTAASAA